MNRKKWNEYVMSPNLPPSLTSTDEGRRKEAEAYCKHATEGFEQKKSILVLGCGDGYELEILRDLGFKRSMGLTLLDQEMTRGVKGVVQGDVHEIPFDDKEFDYVISKEVMEHCIAPPIALMEINRVLKDGGKFSHYIPEGTNKQRDWYHYFCMPDWLWVDLMYKNGLDVTSLTHAFDQNCYKGGKFQDPNWMTSLYDLDGKMKTLR